MKSKHGLLAGLIFVLVVASLGWFLVKKPTSTQQLPQIKEAATPAPSFDKTAHSLTDPASIWVIASKSHPLNPLDYAPTDLVNVGNSQQMRKEAATALSKLQAGAAQVNLTMKPVSGYRSYARQKVVYQNEVNNYGQATADTESAKAGYSEHQTGWAIDIGAADDSFANTPESKWLADNAYKYGFIIRYPQGKQDVTGYRYEPWHIRYVGTDLSQEMHDKNIITLEEFFGL